jgi:signal transduction histidine kinase
MYQRAHQAGGGSSDAAERPGETLLPPAERASRAEVEQSLAKLSGHPLLGALLDVADVSIVILNRQRQILVANSELLRSLPRGGAEAIGLRAGEALCCVHAAQRPGGCGSSPECTQCGAVLAVLESERRRVPVERECLMTVDRGEGIEALELRVRASQVELAGERYTVLGLRDISAEKRRDALERVFLHDVANTAGPLLAWAQLLQLQPAETQTLGRRIAGLATRLVADIEDQRSLLQAENGTLETHRSAVRPEAALEVARAVLDGHPGALGRTIDIVRGEPFTVMTDESLLVRVLVNMMKNALEATAEGGRVEAAAVKTENGCELRVWNAGAIAPEVALQIFKRSFSTKPGRGRGLGTFSIKLFGERYLGGVVGFRSSEVDGTTFFIRLPG